MRAISSVVWGIAAGACLAFTATASQAQVGDYGRYNWTGVYFGAHAGGAHANIDWTLDTGGPDEFLSNKMNGFVYGGQVGLQYMWSNGLLIGLEASLTLTNDLDDSVVSTVIANRTRSAGIDDIVLAGGRIGYGFQRSLFYAKGGYAEANVTTRTNVLSSGTLGNRSNGRAQGWNVGGGWEYAVTPAIILGIQYDFIKLDVDDRFGVNLPGFSAANHVDFDTDVHMVTARLSFKLGPTYAAPLK